MSEELRKVIHEMSIGAEETKDSLTHEKMHRWTGELKSLLAKQEAAPPRLSEERVLCIKLDAICAHLNHPNPIQSTDVMTAVKLAEDAAEWARFHIEERGRQNDELRAALASVPQPPPVPNASGDVEQLAAKFHDIYQQEAKRQGDVRHKDSYADLSENIKEFDRVLARYVLQRDRELIERGVRATIERVKEGLGYNYEEHSFGEFLRALDVAAIVDKALKEKE